MVCVDYADILALTLPYNIHHFKSIVVATTPNDVETIKVCNDVGATVHLTEVFYANGAKFNKFAALEECLDIVQHDDWLAIMDADIAIPKIINTDFAIGNLYSPFRRMLLDISNGIPEENTWQQLPLYNYTKEHLGYLQIFHPDDIHLGSRPWHGLNWSHAGGGDSFFQYKWSDKLKLRPDWECLHLGPAEVNWCGRTSVYVNGEKPLNADNNLSELRGSIKKRKLFGLDAWKLPSD